MLSLHRWSIFTVRVHLFLICGTVLTVGKMYYYHISSTFWRKSNRCSPPQVLLWKGVLKIYSKDTGEQLQIDFIDITLCHGSSPVNFLHISRISLFKNTSGGLLLKKKRLLQNNLIEITLRHGCIPVKLLPIFRISSPKNTFGGLLLKQKKAIMAYLGFSPVCIFYRHF